MFSLVAILLLFASSTNAASCLADTGIHTSQVANILQQSNGNPALTISTSGIIGQFTFGTDNCLILIQNLVFTINAKTDADPQIRLYGKKTIGDEIGFPIQDGFIPVKFVSGGPLGFTYTFEKTYSIPLTRTGALVGGISFDDFKEIIVFSDAYQWQIASAVWKSGSTITPPPAITPPPSTSVPPKSQSNDGFSRIAGLFSFIGLLFV